MLGSKTKAFLEFKDPEIIDYLDNSNELIQKSPNIPKLIDYSPLVVPAFKALERWFFLIAPAIGIPKERVDKVRVKDQSFGSMITWDELEKFFEDVLERLDTTQETKDVLRAEIGSLKSFLKTYRHAVAHCWNKVESPTEADMHFKSTVSGMRRITDKLIDTGLINKLDNEN